MKAIFLLVLVIAVAEIGWSAMGYPDCKADHCSRVSPQLNEACIAAGQAGKPFPVISADGGVCTCPCSCVITGTAIDLENGYSYPIESVVKTDLVFNPYADSIVELKTFSTVTKHDTKLIEFEDGSTIQTSKNHTFVTPNESIISADRLKIGDHVLDGQKKSIRISAIKIQKYSGDLHNLVTNSQSSLVSDHIVVTNNILSGDLLVQDANDRIQNEIDLRMKVVKPVTIEGAP